VQEMLHCRQNSPAMISDECYLRNVVKGLVGQRRVAPEQDDFCIRKRASEFVDESSRFSSRGGRDGAGIDDTKIGNIAFGRFPHAEALEQEFDLVPFGLSDFATERIDFEVEHR